MEGSLITIAAPDRFVDAAPESEPGNTAIRRPQELAARSLIMPIQENHPVFRVKTKRRRRRLHRRRGCILVREPALIGDLADKLAVLGAQLEQDGWTVIEAK